MTAPVYTISPAVIDELGFGELVDACDAAGIEVNQVSSVKGNARMRLFLAMAWIIARRDEPTLTWAAMQRARLEVVDTPKVNPISQLPAKRTASGSPRSRSRSA